MSEGRGREIVELWNCGIMEIVLARAVFSRGGAEARRRGVVFALCSLCSLRFQNENHIEHKDAQRHFMPPPASRVAAQDLSQWHEPLVIHNKTI